MAGPNFFLARSLTGRIIALHAVETGSNPVGSRLLFLGVYVTLSLLVLARSLTG